MSPAIEGDGATGVVPLPLVEGRPATRVVLAPPPGDGTLPRATWTGLWRGTDPAEAGLAGADERLGVPLLGEHTHDLFTRPHLRGHRLRVDGTRVVTGTDWSTRFEVTAVESVPDRWRLEASDPAAGLDLALELESAPGGVLRTRGTVRNTGEGGWALDGFELVLPVPDDLGEVLDLTGRHERERSPQRHLVTDGLWLRESRGGRPGLGSATTVALGRPGFGTADGDVLACHVAWSGSSVLRVERSPELGTTVGGGELLLPGEVVLGQGESYTTPWVLFASADDGLDGLAASWHAYQRALPAHPDLQPVVLNCWEAVYFDHDPAHLRTIADRAARVGVERFVLDDGWFLGRRDDTAGLGDWEVDQTVWPRGLEEIADHVHALGMEFGLWFEPEMVNPRSRLFAEHPDWVLATGGRLPRESRHQQVLDLSRPEVRDHLVQQISTVLDRVEVDYVKWDHNRELLEAGSAPRGGAPVVREQTLGFYDLLDRLAAAHPHVAWESCASGGGRIDLGVAERVQRFWTSDMTDALARQQIQRWTVQLVAPELLGAHVSSPVSHTTGRTLSLDFRCATALFGAFGIEWDLTEASEDDLELLASWVQRHQTFRPLLHGGRTVRPESADPSVQLHGVVAADGREALLAHVQLDEAASNRGVTVRVPGLDPDAVFDLAWEGPVEHREVSKSLPLPPEGPTGGRPMSGRALATVGYWVPRRRPETVTLTHLRAR